MGFSCLKDTEPLRQDSFLFAIHFPGFPGVPGTQLLALGRMKDYVDLEPGIPELGIQRLKHMATACFNLPPCFNST